MNKKKLMVVVVGLGVLGIAKLLGKKIIENKKKQRKMEENLVELSLLQDDFNKEVLEEFQSIKDEIGAVYEHIGELAGVFEKNKKLNETS